MNLNRYKTSASTPVRICMVAMFKNDAMNIRHMLESVAPHIDYWVMQDNGSTDGTTEIIKEWATKHKLPGVIYQNENGWVNFAVNQDSLLQAALKEKHNCNWIMKMDPNEILEVDDDFDWKLLTENVHSFQVPGVFDGSTLYRAWIWNAKLPWKFENTPDNYNISLNDGVHGENFHRQDLPISFRMKGINNQIRIVKKKSSKPIGVFDGEKYVKPAKICMISMFKNEADNIRTMLDSVAPYITYWVLQDNGSTDGTPDIVKKWAEETKIPGHLYQVEEGWVNFGWNRDHLLQTTQKLDHGCDWIMKMDCDETLEVDDDFDWTPFSENHQSFHVTSLAPGIIYFRAWIWRAGLPWRFNHDPAHETISLDDGIHGENFVRTNLSKSFKMIGGQRHGESYSVPTKYVTDALKLEEKLIREGTMLTDLYHFWYIGKSYEDCYRGNFFPLKDVHQQEYARRCIFYFSSLVNHTHGSLNAVRVDEMAYYALCSIGNAHRFLKNHAKAIEHYKLAENFAPLRNDHIIYLTEIYWELKDYKNMLDHANRLNDPSRINPFPNYHFLINPHMYLDSAPDGGVYLKQLRDLAVQNINEPTSIFKLNNNQKKRIWIVDNFYSDPNAIREFALKQEYEPSSDWYKGSRTYKKFLTDEVKHAFEDIMGVKIREWESHGMNGKFQFCVPQDPLVYHYDTQTWAAIVYLTPDAPFSTGTSLYAHKETKIRHVDEHPESENCFSGGYYDSTKFELVDTVGNVFNRLIIFDARSFHAATGYFGKDINDSRLFQIFFFD